MQQCADKMVLSAFSLFNMSQLSKTTQTTAAIKLFYLQEDQEYCWARKQRTSAHGWPGGRGTETKDGTEGGEGETQTSHMRVRTEGVNGVTKQPIARQGKRERESSWHLHSEAWSMQKILPFCILYVSIAICNLSFTPSLLNFRQWKPSNI